jgi:hypothetical protein
LNRPNEEQVHVTLTQLLTEGSTTMHPRWLVVFPDTHMEEVYEHRFGKVVTRAPGEEETPESRRSSASNSPMPPANSESKANGNATNSSSGKNSPSSETDVEGKRKSVSFPHHESDGGDSASHKNKSAREARSRRRQAIIDEVPGSTTATGVTNGSSTNGSSISNPALKRKNSTGSNKGGKKTKRPDTPADETVTKVKLLTGTLYLYRGSHPRAEFVRRI